MKNKLFRAAASALLTLLLVVTVLPLSLIHICCPCRPMPPERR